MSAKGTRAAAALEAAGVPFRLHEYDLAPSRDGHHAYGTEAADALGVARDRVVKTLVATVDGRPAVAVVPVSAELDPKAFAEALGGRRAALAELADAERLTGYVRGGISPFGMRRALPTVVDRAVLRQPTVFVSAGRRGLQLELAPDDLVRLTGARVALVARAADRSRPAEADT